MKTKDTRIQLIGFYISRNLEGSEINLKQFLDDLESIIIIKTLQIHNGDTRRTAGFLGICYRTLLSKIHRLQIQFEKKIYFQNLVFSSDENFQPAQNENPQ